MKFLFNAAATIAQAWIDETSIISPFFRFQVSVGVVYDDQDDSFDIPIDNTDIDSNQVLFCLLQVYAFHTRPNLVFQQLL